MAAELCRVTSLEWDGTGAPLFCKISCRLSRAESTEDFWTKQGNQLSATEFVVDPQWVNAVGQVTSVLEDQMTARRLTRLRESLENRKRGVLTLFENTHHSHNISAVLRTLDALGFLESIFVYNQPEMRFRARDQVERGASKWLLTRRARSIPEVAALLRESGYHVALVSLPEFSQTSASYRKGLPEFSADQLTSREFLQTTQEKPIALVLGAELKGISDEWLAFADSYISVRMQGFVESLNVSVCAGILLHALREYCECLGGTRLTERERALVLDFWTARSVQNSRELCLMRRPELLPYFEMVRAGAFFRPLHLVDKDRL